MPDFKPGQTVQLNDGRRGTVRFAGQTHFQVGEWIGVELEDKTGKNDGSVQGERYFDCPMGYGMFVKPMMVTIISQPSTAKPSAVRRPAARPNSFQPASTRPSASGDVALTKRRSMNAPSPSPGPKTTRRASLSPIKSPTKPLSGPPSSSASRTGTPSNVRTASAGARARPSLGAATRQSMGPPALPASRTTRPNASPAPLKLPGAPARTAAARTSLGGLRTLSRPGSGRRPSGDSQATRDSGSADNATPSSSPKSAAEILSPQPKSPVKARTTKTLERLADAASAPGPSASAAVRRTATGTTNPRSASTAAAQREVEDLKAKLKVLERKRAEDRDKLKQLEKIQGERDKFEGIIQKLQQKYLPQQQENAELKKQLKEAEARFEAIETMQAEQETAFELATLDREMAEETAEVLKMELDTLKQKSEETELELEILREENAEYSRGMTTEERSSTSWLQMERTNERLREALLRLRDITQAQEGELRDQITGLEEDIKDFTALKDEYEAAKEKLAKSEAAVEDLRQQLDTALGAEDMLEDLTERNMSMAEQIEELKAVIDDLENLKEINDELEANHVQHEKEMQEDLDFKDSVIAEQARRAAQQEEAFEDMEYTVSRFRELVTSLQSDLEDMRASQAVTEGESEKLNDRSRAMMDLNMKLQISAAKAQVKTIDLELRRLDAQEAEQHLEIVKLFLPDSYKEDQDSVLSLLRFRRLAFKANLLNGFIKERVNGQPHPGQEDDVVAGCDAIDQLVWVSSMCDRFVNDISHCSLEQFSKYQHALLELEPVERALNSWIDGLRRDDLKEKKCADELHRTVAVLSHLAEVHISTGLSNFADEVHMMSVVIQSRMDSAAVAFSTARTMVQRALPSDSEINDEDVVQQLAKSFDLAITQTRGTKVIAGKAVRALEDLKTRSLSLLPDTRGAFEQCESGSQELSSLARSIGNAIHQLLTQDEGRTQPFTVSEVSSAIRQAVAAIGSAADSDPFSVYMAKLRTVNGQMTDLAALSADLNQTQEFEVCPQPWRLRSQELKALKTVPVDAEEELRRLKEEYNEARRTIAQRDEHLSTAVLKIETLESRMRDAQANVDRITQLQKELVATGEQAASLKEDIEKQDRELKSLEQERDKWKKIASDSRAYADGADAADVKAGQERAVATAREMDALKKDIESLQAAVRYLREDNRRARVKEQQKHDWLAEPLKKQPSVAAQRKELVVTEAKDVLGELVKMATSATIFDFSALPRDKLAWKPAKLTPQYHAARQMEDYAAWTAWQESTLQKSTLLRRGGIDRLGGPVIQNPAAQLQIRLPGVDGKMMTGAGLGRHGVQVVGSSEWEALQGSRMAAV
ncbi:Dynactin [Hirsutella minnesotensis 3608]|nr:Dynactin [Hirsutella minnesotensis 3608]